MSDTDRAHSSPTRAGRLFYTGAYSTSLVVGALQMFHVRGGPLTDYGADVFGTAWFYAMFRQGRTIIQRDRPVGPGTAAVIVFVLCAASEFGQKVNVVPGRFDPYDLAAFAISVVSCWVADAALGPFVESG